MNKNIPKNPQIFSCEKCNLITCNKKDFNKHCMTRKHLINHNLEHLEQKIPKNPFTCKYCNKGYKVRNSLWYHEKKCINVSLNEYDTNNNNNDNNNGNNNDNNNSNNHN